MVKTTNHYNADYLFILIVFYQYIVRALYDSTTLIPYIHLIFDVYLSLIFKYCSA